jgi:formylglycine-generating enzyme required for sulfatase activity
LQSRLGVHDSLFIYYAGHGHLDNASKQGFWIPVDGGTDRYAQENWLSNSLIRGYISGFKTIHVFLVSDACFSGDILNVTRSLPPQIDNAYYRKAYALTTRQVLTSGSSETVPDESEFSEAIKMCLRKNTAPLLDPIGMYNDVRLSVRSTTPLYGTLTSANHQDGATFLFFRKQANVPVSTNLPPQVTGSISVSSEIAGEIIVDGQARGVRVKEGGVVTVNGVDIGVTEVAVREDNGTITKAQQTVRVLQGQTVAAVIERPVPANMVRINGGTFTMGSPASEAGRDDDYEVQHRVMVSSFYMWKYEVTVGEFRRFVNATGYKTEAETGNGGYIWTGSAWEIRADANWKNPYFSQGDNNPVVLVSWNDAIRYCNWLSEQEGLSPAYTVNGNNVTWNANATGYRLPTEAEWEYACRAGTTTAYNTGAAINTNTGWYSANSNNTTHPVGQKAANTWGLYDMHGNVYEWCWDWLEVYSSNAQTDPRGASSGSRRVVRGGSWGYSAQNLRSASRGSYAPSVRLSHLGFRLVLP